MYNVMRIRKAKRVRERESKKVKFTFQFFLKMQLIIMTYVSQGVFKMGLFYVITFVTQGCLIAILMEEFDFIIF